MKPNRHEPFSRTKRCFASEFGFGRHSDCFENRPLLGKTRHHPDYKQVPEPHVQKTTINRRSTPRLRFCPFGDHKELSARLTSQRQCRRRWTEKKRQHAPFAAAAPTQLGRRRRSGAQKKEVTLTLRSGCADAGGPRKKRDDNHTSHRLGRRRGRREKTYGTHTSQRLCLRRGAGKTRADTRTWQRLRQRRGGEKSDGTPSSQRLCRRRRAEKNEMTLLLRSGCTGVRGPMQKT